MFETFLLDALIRTMLTELSGRSIFLAIVVVLLVVLSSSLAERR